MIIIHKFKNPYLLKFLCKYKEEIEAFPNGMHEKYQIGTSSDHCGFRYTLISDKAPFGQADDRIAVNEDKCNELGLSDEERDACLFHELGHIVNPSDSDGLEKELKADRLAVDYGLKDYLISALEKMVTSGNYCEESQREMSERIEHWRQFNA